MKQYLTIYRNWRLLAIIALAFVALILGCDEAERSFLAFMLIKLASAALMLLVYCLAKHWHAAGYFSLIDELVKE